MTLNTTTPVLDTFRDETNTRGKQLLNGVEEGIDQAHSAAQKAVTGAANKLGELQHSVQPVIERIASRGAEIAQDGVDATREAGARAKTVVTRYATACENYVIEQPMKSVAIAAVAGATLAALLMLSRKR